MNRLILVGLTTVLRLAGMVQAQGTAVRCCLTGPRP